MKLSEAILLGSTVLTPRAGGQHFAETQSGCALGMAAIANGCTFHTVKQLMSVNGGRSALKASGEIGFCKR